MWARFLDLPPRPAGSRFRIALNAAGIPTEYRNTEYVWWFRDMRRYFERIITGVAALPGQNVVLDIDVGFASLASGALGQCGPGDGNWWNIPAFLGDLRLDSGTQTATVRHATMMFNTDYYKANPVTETDKAWKRQFFTTAIHECFHAVGIGSLWNGPFRIVTYVPPIPIINPEGSVILLSTVFPYNIVGTGNPTNAAYTRSAALAEYRAQMVGQGTATSIPIENYGMSANTIMTEAGGTALAHWKGSIAGTPSGIVNHQGQDLIDEVMTAWSDRYEGVNRWVSRFTIAGLKDIGWEVDYAVLERPLNEYKSVDY